MAAESNAQSLDDSDILIDRMDLTGLEEFFLEHEELFTRGLTLKQAVFYYGETRKSLKAKVEDGTIPAIRLPEEQGRKWRVFPDGVPEQLQSMIPKKLRPKNSADFAGQDEMSAQISDHISALHVIRTVDALPPPPVASDLIDHVVNLEPIAEAVSEITNSFIQEDYAPADRHAELSLLAKLLEIEDLSGDTIPEITSEATIEQEIQYEASLNSSNQIEVEMNASNYGNEPILHDELPEDPWIWDPSIGKALYETSELFKLDPDSVPIEPKMPELPRLQFGAGSVDLEMPVQVPVAETPQVDTNQAEACFDEIATQLHNLQTLKAQALSSQMINFSPDERGEQPKAFAAEQVCAQAQTTVSEELGTHPDAVTTEYSSSAVDLSENEYIVNEFEPEAKSTHWTEQLLEVIGDDQIIPSSLSPYTNGEEDAFQNDSIHLVADEALFIISSADAIALTSTNANNAPHFAELPTMKIVSADEYIDHIISGHQVASLSELNDAGFMTFSRMSVPDSTATENGAQSIDIESLLEKIADLEKQFESVTLKNNYLETRVVGLEDQVKFLEQSHYSTRGFNKLLLLLPCLAMLAIIYLIRFTPHF